MTGTVELRVTQNKLEVVDAWHAADVIRSIERDMEVSQAEAELLFQQTKRFLYKVSLLMDKRSPSIPVDRAWHAFILCTQSYSRFCSEVLGVFVHHEPFTTANGVDDVGFTSLDECQTLVREEASKPRILLGEGAAFADCAALTESVGQSVIQIPSATSSVGLADCASTSEGLG